MKIFSSIPDPLKNRLQRLFHWLLAFAACFILWKKWQENPVAADGWQMWQLTAACTLAALGLLIESMIWWLPARRIAPLLPVDAFRNTLIFLYHQIFISSGLSEWSARYFQFKEEDAKKRAAGVLLAVQTSKWIVRLFLSGMLLWFMPHLLPAAVPGKWLAALCFLLGTTAMACILWPEKLQTALSRKWQMKLSAYVTNKKEQAFPLVFVLSLAGFKVGLDTVALTLLIHPNASFDAQLFQELYLQCASFYVLAGFLPSLGPADGILRGAAGSFYFIDGSAHMNAAAASIFLLWTFNVALPGAIGGLLELLNKRNS